VARAEDTKGKVRKTSGEKGKPGQETMKVLTGRGRKKIQYRKGNQNGGSRNEKTEKEKEGVCKTV